MNLPRRLALVITLCSVGLMLAATFSLAQAAPDGGVVGTGTPASCTEAALDARLSGGGSITFNCGANPYTLVITTGKTISVNTTIDGGGKITLSGGDTVKVFFVNPSVRLTLNNLTLEHGNSPMGGCVTVQGTLNATNTTFQNCTSHTAWIFPGSGGALFNWGGTIALTNSIILKNKVDLNGGGLYVMGGQATLNHVDVLSNTAWVTHTGSGGGVYVDANSNFVASDSHFSYNGMGWQGEGGGLHVYSSTALLVNVSADYNHGLNAADGGGFYVKNSQFTLQGGSASGNYGTGTGGGLNLQNSVSNLSNVTISRNKGGSGGGLLAYKGSLTLNHVAVNNNNDPGSGGSDGGGIYLYQTPTTLADSTVNNNYAERSGAGIYSYRSTLTMDQVTVSGNVNSGEATAPAEGDGGGIVNDSGTLIASNSTIDHNTSTGTAGGLYNANDSTLLLTNVTISGNRAAVDGGGLYNETNFSVADWTYITMTNVTIKDNVAAHGSGLWNGTDAHNFVYLKNTVIADSVGGNCYGKALTAAQYSLFTDSTCVVSSGTGNQTPTPAGLFPLMDNGGQTQTHLPGPASPLVNGVVGVDCPIVDQRGIARPQGLGCDIGAVERQAADATSAPWIYVPLLKR